MWWYLKENSPTVHVDFQSSFSVCAKLTEKVEFPVFVLLTLLFLLCLHVPGCIALTVSRRCNGPL